MPTWTHSMRVTGRPFRPSSASLTRDILLRASFSGFARGPAGRTSLNSAAMAATHRDVKASGVRLRVALSGPTDAAPVVLLHGLFMDHRTWDGTVAALAPEFRVVAPDFPGFGDSEKPAANRFSYDVTAFAEVVADLYAGLDLGRAAVIGHGLGGAVAITLAAKHAELVSRLVLVDCLCFEAPLDFRRRIALLPLVGGFVLKQLWGRTTFRSVLQGRVLPGREGLSGEKVDRYYDSFNAPSSRGSALATLRATVDTRGVGALTARVAAPTLVVWGRNDRMFPAGIGQRLSRQIRGAGFELMDAGHAPHEERSEEFSAIVARFLRAERPSGT
jgi:pimeloyl-ACP methyl ester carboxylesterase